MSRIAWMLGGVALTFAFMATEQFAPHCLITSTEDAPSCEVSLVEDTPLRPAAVFQGTHSLIKKEVFKVIKTKEAWKTLWTEHRGQERIKPFIETVQTFEVDFDTHLVAAVFSGGSDWCDVSASVQAREVVIRFRAITYQIDGMPLGFGDEALTTLLMKKRLAQRPYAFIVLRKPVKSVVIEQDVRQRLDFPPEWKHRVTFSDLE